MSKLTDELRSKGIFNSYSFAYERGRVNDNYPFERPTPPTIEGIPHPIPIVSYSKGDSGRAFRPAQWMVSQPGVVLDPKCHWQDKQYDGSCPVVFGLWGAPGITKANQRKQVEQIALQWARDRFGIQDWIKNPFGEYMPAEFVKARLAQLKAFNPQEASS